MTVKAISDAEAAVAERALTIAATEASALDLIGQTSADQNHSCAWRHAVMSWKHFAYVAAVCLSIALSAAGCRPSSPEAETAISTPGGDPAAALVQRFEMGAGLESLANRAAGATTTFATLAQQHGVAKAKQWVAGEISKLVPAYQARWDRNLATIYAKHFTADELRSLATQGTRSPHAAKFRSTQATVAAEMQEASSPLLQQLVTEALRNVLQR